MDNAYQQKLQERAYQLCKKWHGNIVRFYEQETKIAAIEPFLPLAALTLEWSANAYKSGHIDGYMEGSLPWEPQNILNRLQQKGFIPPKTDNNEG